MRRRFHCDLKDPYSLGLTSWPKGNTNWGWRFLCAARSETRLRPFPYKKSNWKWPPAPFPDVCCRYGTPSSQSAAPTWYPCLVKAKNIAACSADELQLTSTVKSEGVWRCLSLAPQNVSTQLFSSGRWRDGNQRWSRREHYTAWRRHTAEGVLPRSAAVTAAQGTLSGLHRRFQ